MKKLLFSLSFLSFILCVQVAYAWNCQIFQVHIKNIGSMDCTLKKSYLISGKLFHNTHIPEVIFRNTEAQFEIMPKWTKLWAAEVLMSYQCGDDKDITIHSRSIIGKGDNVVQSIILESNNVEATFTDSNAFCFADKGWFANSTWVLNP